MRVKSLLAVISTSFYVMLMTVPTFAQQKAEMVESIDGDAIEADALQYGHAKRFSEISIYGSITSQDSDQGVGGGASLVVKSLDHMLFETGLAYLQTGSEIKGIGAVELSYLVLPLSVKLFLRPENMGFYLRSALTVGRLLNAKNDGNRAEDFDSQIWLGAGGLFRSQMENHVFVDFVWGRSLEPVLKDTRVRNESVILSAGLVL